MYARITLENPDSTLVGIGCVVVSAHTFFKSESLVNTGEHVGVVTLCFVVCYETALPQRTDGFDALELVRLLPLVACDWKLVTSQLALPSELVEDGVLHEISLHVPAHGNALPP